MIPVAQKWSSEGQYYPTTPFYNSLQYFYDIYYNRRQKKNLLRQQDDENYGFDLVEEKEDDNSKAGQLQLLE